MDNDDVEGARAAAEYFMEVSGYAVRSQDLSIFRDLCGPESHYCAAIIEQVTQDMAAGIVTVGGEKTFTAVAVDPPTERAGYVVWGTLSRTSFTVYGPAGEEIDTLDAETGVEFAIEISHQSDGEWSVLAVQAGVVKPS